MSDMKINGVNGSSPALPAAKPAQNGESSEGFNAVMDDVMGKLNQVQTDAQSAVESLSSGGDVMQAIISMEQANMNFQVMVEVRNKLIAAYEEVMRMQV